MTGNQTYKDAAITSANWIAKHDVRDYVVLDTVSAQDCSNNNWIFTYNSGKFIEGISILANITGDTQWNDLYVCSCYHYSSGIANRRSI